MNYSLDFEWDDEKAKTNLKKHGVSFQLARRVFADDLRLEFFDEKHSLKEDRYITIGAVGDTVLVLYVVFTEREERIRIISARKATAPERRLYYDRKNNV